MKTFKDYILSLDEVVGKKETKSEFPLFGASFDNTPEEIYNQRISEIKAAFRTFLETIPSLSGKEAVNLIEEKDSIIKKLENCKNDFLDESKDSNAEFKKFFETVC